MINCFTYDQVYRETYSFAAMNFMSKLIIACLLLCTNQTFSQSEKENVSQDSSFTISEVDEPAKFPGGVQGWKNYLQKNLRGDAPLIDKSRAGIYSITVQFVVDTNGLVRDVKAIDIPDGCRTCVKEAVRVLKKGPNWLPAKRNGIPVRYLAKQKVNFIMT